MTPRMFTALGYQKLELPRARRAGPVVGGGGGAAGFATLPWRDSQPCGLRTLGKGPLPLGRAPASPATPAPLPAPAWSRSGQRAGPMPVPRRRGSRTSRRASPSMLKPKTAREIAAPGKMAIHGARCMKERPEPASMAPQDGLRRRDAQAEEGQRGLGQDDAAEPDGGEDDDGRGDVGQHVAKHDAQVPAADRARGLDVRVLHHAERRAADDPRAGGRDQDGRATGSG